MPVSLDVRFIFPLCAYLLGSIPFGLLIARTRGIDIRGAGSGNIGATNVARVVGKMWGFFTLCLDLVKGLLPVLVYKVFVQDGPDDVLFLAITGFTAVAGHCYSIFLRLHGGKGVATAAGVFLGLCPYAVLLAAVVFSLVLKKWGYVSLGSLTATIALPVFFHFLCGSTYLEVMAWAIAIIIWIKHRDNIRRLINGEEKGFKVQAQGP